MAEIIDLQVRGFLEVARRAHLATADAMAQPLVVPVCYALVDDLLYVPLDSKPKAVPPTSLKRVRNIVENPYLCLVVDRWDEDWSNLAYVLIWGMGAVTDVPEEKTQAIAELRRRYPQYRSMALEGNPLIRIMPYRIKVWGRL
jgi:PPOX class probable F420-dependent enzyme